MKTKHRQYPAYKDSGIEWLGNIPEHWEVLPAFSLLAERNEKNDNDINNNILSLSYGRIVVRPKNDLSGLLPESFSTYQLVYPNDIIIRPTDLQNDKVSWRFGYSTHQGIITSAYINLKCNSNVSYPYFIYLYLHSLDIRKVIYAWGSGLRQNLSFDNDIKRMPTPLPPLEEQRVIADYLDRKSGQIDRAVEQKEQTIALLEEYKQTLINDAVTRGLNPNAPTKDSGVEWIGTIPKHWEVRKIKYIAAINNKTLSENTHSDFSIKYVDIGSVSFTKGIEQYECYTFKTAPSRARRCAEEGDTAISTVRTYLKAIAYINKEFSDCIFSTGFAILTPNRKIINNRFLSIAVKSDFFTNQVDIAATGLNYPTINSTNLGTLYINLPPLSEQKEIVGYIEKRTQKIDRAIRKSRETIEKLKEYKSTLIDSAVRGEICLME